MNDANCFLRYTVFIKTSIVGLNIRTRYLGSNIRTSFTKLGETGLGEIIVIIPGDGHKIAIWNINVPFLVINLFTH